MTHPTFSFLTVLLLLIGWATHWLVSVRKAKVTAIAAKTTAPTLLSYWKADPEATVLSVISVVAFYFIAPWMAVEWPALGTILGTTVDNPLNPLAAYLGGYAGPSLSDWAGKRISKMVGDEPPKP
jgi:uncharacterized membrane protein